MRNIIVHYHIFKNAGTTIDSILQQSFPDLWVPFDLSSPGASINQVELEGFIRANPKVKVFSSHQARLPAPVSANFRVYPLVFLRHPIDRIASIYHYLRRLPDSEARPAINFAKSHNMADFVRWRLGTAHGAVIRNFQTVYLSGETREVRLSVASPDHLVAAYSQLVALPFFGLVEAFDASISRMSDFLFPAFGPINTQHSVLNANHLRPNTLEERLDQIQIELGEGLYSQILDANSYDLALYRDAESLFFSR
jgi:hypothetical protein